VNPNSTASPPKPPIPKAFDIVVCGGTPAGVAAAVRAARGGHRVLLTQHNRHLGGMCANGIGQWDAKSDHRRCPLFAEVLQRLETHYRETYGPDSEALQAARYRTDSYPVGCFEPSVIEGVFNDMVAAQQNITLWTSCYPESATVRDRTIATATFRAWAGTEQRAVSAQIFVDATYEGDLAAAAGVPCRIGREGVDEFGEPHAGLQYTSLINEHAPSLARQGVINILTFRMRQGPIDPASPGTADRCIQAYNLRPCICRDPAKRILLEREPDRYDRAAFLPYTRKGLAISASINNKNSYNAPILPGENHDYPAGDWDTRLRIDQRHRDFALGLMWFLQHDSTLSAAQRDQHRQWGLPADEFTDNGHLPYELYVRETRRIVGRHTLTENDLLPRDGFLRPRPFADSVGFTDWYMDSHSCSADIGTMGPGAGRTGSADYPFDGKLILTEEFRPGMIPYRALVPENIDNLLVPVCASATHIAWGSVRLEPVWIQLGEVAGFAACQALARNETVGTLDTAHLQQTLLAAGASIAFFNQHRQAADDPRRPDRELAACHGEHDSYDMEATEG